MQYKDKKIIVFDLDGTLTRSKSPLEPAIADALMRLLEVKKVAVITGGSLEQMQKQFLADFPAGSQFENLFIMPTSGASLDEWKNGNWKEIYRVMLSEDERLKIKVAFEKALNEIETENPAVKPTQLFGERIEDRGSQVTFSGLGQLAPVELKGAWDPDHVEKKAIVQKLEALIPEFSIHIGGSTSIDVTKKGIDKAYGIHALEKFLNIPIAEMLYVGDALFVGGNDWAAKTTGVDCHKVSGPDETKEFIESFLQTNHEANI